MATLLERWLRELESDQPVPGTIIQRVLMDSKLLAQNGLRKLHDRQDHLVWCVAIGTLAAPWKKLYYGHSLRETIRKAYKEKRIRKNNVR